MTNFTLRQCNCLHDEKDVQHFFAAGYEGVGGFDFLYCHDCELAKSKTHYVFRLPYENEVKAVERNSRARFVEER